jgi:hypothetical protein
LVMSWTSRLLRVLMVILCMIAVRRLQSSSPRQIPRPAGESAGLRDDSLQTMNPILAPH